MPYIIALEEELAEAGYPASISYADYMAFHGHKPGAEPKMTLEQAKAIAAAFGAKLSTHEREHLAAKAAMCDRIDKCIELAQAVAAKNIKEAKAEASQKKIKDKPAAAAAT